RSADLAWPMPPFVVIYYHTSRCQRDGRAVKRSAVAPAAASEAGCMGQRVDEPCGSAPDRWPTRTGPTPSRPPARAGQRGGGAPPPRPAGRVEGRRLAQSVNRAPADGRTARSGLVAPRRLAGGGLPVRGWGRPARAGRRGG